jgi:hypothetical protein
MAEDRGHDGDVFLGSDEGSLSEDESTATATTTVPSCAMESFLAQSIGDLKLTDLQQSYFDQHHNHVGGIEPSQGGSADDNVLRLAEVPSDDSSEEGFLSFEEDEEEDVDPVSSEEVGCPDDSSNFRFPSQTEESGLGESGPVVDPAAATTPPLAESWEIVDEDHFSMKSGKGDTPNGGDNGGKEHGGDNAVEQEEAAKATVTNSQPPSRNWLGGGSKHGGTARSGGGGAGLGLAARLMPSFPSSFRAGPTPPGAAAAAVSPTHLLLLPPPVSHLCVPRGMHIAILVCGTRGDVQPFVIIGQKLQVTDRQKHLWNILVDVLVDTLLSHSSPILSYFFLKVSRPSGSLSHSCLVPRLRS